MVLFEMLGQQAEETKEDFFDALGEAVLADAVLLDGREVGDFEAGRIGIEGAIVSPVRCKWQPA